MKNEEGPKEKATEVTAALAYAAALAEAKVKLEATVVAAALGAQEVEKAAGLVSLAAKKANDLIVTADKEAVLLKLVAAGAGSVFEKERTADSRALPRSRSTSIIMWVSAVTMSLTLVALGVVLWWLLYPYKGVVNLKIVSSSPTVELGSLYQWNIAYCVDNSPPYGVVIERELELENHQMRFPLPPISYVGTKKCEEFTRSALIPDDLPVGEYHLNIILSVKVNPIRYVHQAFRGDQIEVVAKK